MQDDLLPPEIWASILQRCTHTSHLSLRLVNKALNNLTTPYAFSTIYIGWLHEYFEKAQAIASSRLGQHVRSLEAEVSLIRPIGTPIIDADLRHFRNEAARIFESRVQGTPSVEEMKVGIDRILRESKDAHERLLEQQDPYFDLVRGPDVLF